MASIVSLLSVAYADDIATLTNLGELRSLVRSATHPYAPFAGSGYIYGTENTLGDVYVYVPYDSLGKWGVSDSGYLGNITSSSISGVLYTSNGTRYDFRASGFGLPQYRLYNSSSYIWNDCYLIPTENNIELRTEFTPNGSPAVMYPYVIIGFMGVMVLCMMRFKR